MKESSNENIAAAQPTANASSVSPNPDSAASQRAPQSKRRRKNVMVKPKSTSTIMMLTPEQREQVKVWLCDQNKSYDDVEKWTAEQFQRPINRRALQYFCQKEIRRRNVIDLLNCAEHARAVLKAAGDDPDKTFQALVQVVAQIAFEITARASANKKQLPDLRPLLDALPVLIDARQDLREDKKTAFEREQWEFDVVRMCHNHFTELQTIIGNQTMDEPSRLDAIRRRLFGKN